MTYFGRRLALRRYSNELCAVVYRGALRIAHTSVTEAIFMRQHDSAIIVYSCIRALLVYQVMCSCLPHNTMKDSCMCKEIYPKI